MIIDKNFVSLAEEFDKFQKEAAPYKSTFSVCVLRNNDYTYKISFPIFPDGIDDSRNFRIVERLVKTLLWLVGGHTVFVNGSKWVFQRLKETYFPSGARAFDAEFMARIYEKPLEIVYAELFDFPADKPCSVTLGGHLNGCRIGFDAGGSDRKVSAVKDGEVLFSEEVVWHPKTTSDPSYHKDGIKAAFRKAASYLPKVDAIGVSSAGIYVDNRIMVASLFLAVPADVFDKKVKNMYIECARETCGDVPLIVANDGDVTALAGAMSLGKCRILGIAMGTSEAAGYIDGKGNMNGFLSELAFVPVDLSETACVDEWSGDKGCGVKYFSQDGVIKLAEIAGIDLSCATSPAEKLKIVQRLCEDGNPTAQAVFRDIGEYFAHGVAYYSKFYDVGTVLLLGRVSSGKGGELLLESAEQTLSDRFPALRVSVVLPDEKSRRVGQSVAAASLPEL